MSKRLKRKQKPTWLISFADVVSLMLTFFVLIFSMSEPRKDGWSMAIGNMSSSFYKNFGNPANPGAVETRFNINSITRETGLSLDYLANLIQEKFEDIDSFENISITHLNDKVVIAIPSQLIFQSGSYELSEIGQEAADIISEAVRRIDNRIEIYGHTDPNPVNSNLFASNWELSLWRAQSIANSLYASGYQRDIITKGLSDTYYDDLPESMPDIQKERLARRVDVIIQKDVW